MRTKTRQRTIRGGCEDLEPRQLLALDSLVITEFMAANQATLRDDDGDFSDWIELHNPTAQEISFQGWALTDDPEQQPARWTFPAGTLGPGEYRVVFASGKDRSDDPRAWHTNFRLDADGEVLALVDPSGQIVQQLGSGYPPQQDDVAYGLPLSQEAVVTAETEGRWWVPTAADAGLASDWASPDFDDSQWNPARGGLGFDRRFGYVNFGFERGDLTEWSTSGEIAVQTVAFGATPSQGNYQALLRTNESSVPRFSLETFLGLRRSDLNSIGDVQVTIGAAMKRVVSVEAGAELQFDWNFLTDEPSVGGSQDFAFLSISPGNVVIPLAGVGDAKLISGTDLRGRAEFRRLAMRSPAAASSRSAWALSTSRIAFSIRGCCSTTF